MGKNPRMSAEERRRSILAAAVPLFAQRGFKGTTTKEVARAAGVSEALLYRHFPNKEALYREIKDITCGSKVEHSKMIAQLEPSTSTLIHAIYFLIHVIITGDGKDNDQVSHEDLHRLMINSYLEDGSFARMFLEENVKVWDEMLGACIGAAQEAGDMADNWIAVPCRWWFAHHVAVAVAILNMPEEPVIPYDGSSLDKVVDQAVLFALRGMGLKDEAIKAHYNPGALALFKNKMAAAHESGQ